MVHGGREPKTRPDDSQTKSPTIHTLWKFFSFRWWKKFWAKFIRIFFLKIVSQFYVNSYPISDIFPFVSIFWEIVWFTLIDEFNGVVNVW